MQSNLKFKNNKFGVKKISPNQNLKLLPNQINKSFSLRINGLGPKKMGLVELNNGLTILVPNANLGDLVKVKLEKILPSLYNAWKQSLSSFSLSGSYGLSKRRKNGSIQSKATSVALTQKMGKPLQKTFILGSLIQVIQKGSVKSIPNDIEVGKKVELLITRKGPKNSGLGFYNNDFPIMVPNMKVGSKVEVKITKLKANYAFANISLDNRTLEEGQTKALLSKIERSNSENFSLVLPLNALNFPNFFAFKLNGNFLFLQKSLGLEVGDHVFIKVLRIREKYSMGKVVKILQKAKTQNSSLNPNFYGIAQKRKLKSIIKKMVLSNMHYGERAIKCNANMRSYLWLRKKGKNKNKPFLKGGRYVLNLFKTYKTLKKSLVQLSKYALLGQSFLFVGTKKSASSLIARTLLCQTSFFVNSRWLGGMLTNWKTILKSLDKMKPILKEKQKLIQNLLSSRQRIKDRLLAKVNLLRKKSRKLMLKGKKLLLQLQQTNPPNNFIQSIETILKEKSIILTQNQNYIEKYSILSMKEQKILLLMNSLNSKFYSLLKQKSYIKNQILNTKKTIKEFKQLFLIGQKLATLKNSMLASGKTLWSIFSYRQSNLQSKNFIKSLPNPSVDILNQIISIYSLDNLNNNKNGTKSLIAQPVILSKLLDKFFIYLPFIKKYLLLINDRLVKKEKTLNKLNKTIEILIENLKTLKKKALIYKNLCFDLKSKLLIQQKTLKLLKIKLQHQSSEQRLLKFLPKLRYLPTTSTQIYQKVELLMKKFVDPKMSYVIDKIYDQKLKFTSKKLAAARKQKWQRLEKYFGGITQMSKLSKKQISNNVAIIIGQQEEMNAVRECQKLGIKIFTVVDTNCNPNLSDYIIPANDDSSTSMEYILGQMLTYIRLAQKLKRKISI